MVRVGVVLDRVLREADAGQAGVVERGAVGAADVPAVRRRRPAYAQVLDRCERFPEDPRRVGRAEDRGAAGAAGAGVDVQIAGELGELRLRALGAAEVLLDVGERAEQAFLFAAPQRDADRAPRLDADGLQDAGGFHHDRAADRVVGGAGRGVPRIEVAAEHHDFVLLVAAGDLRDGVVGGLALRIRLVDDLRLRSRPASRRRACARCARSPRCASRRSGPPATMS